MSFMEQVRPKKDVQCSLDMMLTNPYQIHDSKIDKPQFVLSQKTQSVCSIHFLPVSYTIHVGYLPSSRWPRMLGVGDAAKHLAQQSISQTQYTEELGTWMKRWTKGCIVVVSGSFMCERYELNHVTTDGFGTVTIDFEKQFWELIKALT